MKKILQCKESSHKKTVECEIMINQKMDPGEISGADRGLAGEIFRHFFLVGASLSLAYNTYKKCAIVEGGLNAVPPELKATIKSAFPWASLIFIFLFLSYQVWASKDKFFLTFWKYLIVIVSYLVVVNIIFSNISVLYVLNLSAIYVLLILSLLQLIEKIPSERKFYAVNCDMNWKELDRLIFENPPLLFYSVFLALLIMYALSMTYHQAVPETFLYFSYSMFFSGIGIELYKVSKHRARSEEYADLIMDDKNDP